MSFVSPWALIGLLAVPVLWWLHRRLRRPPVRELPSLMFLLDEDETKALPRGRRFDVELVVALAATILLALGAANPQIEGDDAGRVVRVVVAGGPDRQRAFRVQRALEGLRAALGPRDELIVVNEPVGDPDTRPQEAGLLSAARAGSASARFVIDDRLPRDEPPDVRWIAIGDLSARNQGIVAVSLRPVEQHAELFVNVLNDSDRKETVYVFADARGEQDVVVEIPPFSMRPVRMGSDPEAERIDVWLSPEGKDRVPSDDRVVLTRAPVPVYVDPALHARVVERTQAALVAAVSAAGVRYVRAADAKLAVVPRGWRGRTDATRLEIEAAPEGAAVEPIGTGTDEIGRGPVVRDLATAGTGWVYPVGARVLQPDEDVLLARRGATTWPVVTRTGSRVRLVPDPLRGEPAPVDSPFWPLLIDNLLAGAGAQRVVGAGFRAEGLLDVESSRLGRDARPFDPATLAAAEPLDAASPRSLRTPLVCLGVACLLLLWALPQLRRRLARSAKTHAAAGLAATPHA